MDEGKRYHYQRLCLWMSQANRYLVDSLTENKEEWIASDLMRLSGQLESAIDEADSLREIYRDEARNQQRAKEEAESAGS